MFFTDYNLLWLKKRKQQEQEQINQSELNQLIINNDVDNSIEKQQKSSKIAVVRKTKKQIAISTFFWLIAVIGAIFWLCVAGIFWNFVAWLVGGFNFLFYYFIHVFF